MRYGEKLKREWRGKGREKKEKKVGEGGFKSLFLFYGRGYNYP